MAQLNSHNSKQPVDRYNQATSGYHEEVMSERGLRKKICDDDPASYKHIQIIRWSETTVNLPSAPSHKMAGTTTTLKFRFHTSHSRWTSALQRHVMCEHQRFMTHYNRIPDQNSCLKQCTPHDLRYLRVVPIVSKFSLSVGRANNRSKEANSG
jgi:hypothetical protein